MGHLACALEVMVNMRKGIDLCDGFWLGKRVLVTGHTGFKGSWLTLWLKDLGAKLFGFALPPSSAQSLYNLLAFNENDVQSTYADITEINTLKSYVSQVRPEVIFHLAAQPLVREAYNNPLFTFKTNILGTCNLLQACRSVGTVRMVLIVTSDKVYADTRMAIPHRESDPLGGDDPYSASKACVELIARSFYISYLKNEGISVATARAGNVIGGGDWGADRLIPDAITTWANGLPLKIRNPQSIRPWQHVLDTLNGYVQLAMHGYQKKLKAFSYNFAPKDTTPINVLHLARLAQQRWGTDARILITDEKAESSLEAPFLLLDGTKAQIDLAIEPKWDINAAVNLTVDWYKLYLQGVSPRILCNSNLAQFYDTRNECT